MILCAIPHAAGGDAIVSSRGTETHKHSVRCATGSTSGIGLIMSGWIFVVGRIVQDLDVVQLPGHGLINSCHCTSIGSGCSGLIAGKRVVFIIALCDPPGVPLFKREIPFLTSCAATAFVIVVSCVCWCAHSFILMFFIMPRSCLIKH